MFFKGFLKIRYYNWVKTYFTSYNFSEVLDFILTGIFISWENINIPYYTSFNTQLCTRSVLYVCVCAHLFLKPYLYKYHLSVHVYIYLTNSIYLQIVGVQYFLLINRTCRFTYCFFFKHFYCSKRLTSLSSLTKIRYLDY